MSLAVVCEAESTRTSILLASRYFWMARVILIATGLFLWVDGFHHLAESTLTQ